MTVASIGVFLAFLFSMAQESVLPTMPGHLSMNVMLAIGGVTVASGLFWRTMAVAWGLIAALALVRLQRRERVAKQQVPV